MNNCIKNCFSSENRGHRSGGRGFSLLFYGFTSSELVGRSSVHELRARDSWLVSSELADCIGKLTFTEVERGFGTVKVN